MQYFVLSGSKTTYLFNGLLTIDNHWKRRNTFLILLKECEKVKTRNVISKEGKKKERIKLNKNNQNILKNLSF